MGTYREVERLETEGFVDRINGLRLEGGWYTWGGYVNDCPVQIKGHKTWIQIFKTPTYKDGSPMDMKVGDFKAYLADMADRLPGQ